MKKSLVALAVLAASGASFAQVTVSGSFVYGFEADTNKMVYGATLPTNATAKSAVQDSSGLGIDTSLLTFTAKEDLGGGTTVTAVMSIDGVNRAGINGGDSSITMAGGFGTFKLSNARGADYLSGGVSGVGGVGMDNKLFTPLAASDAISYTSPAYSGFKFAIAHEEPAITQADPGASQVGLGQGAAGADTAIGSSDYQRRNTYTVSYSAGALASNLAYRTYDETGKTAATKTSSYLDMTRGAVSYDFGVAKVGFGFDQRNYIVKGNRMDMLASVSVPFGAFTLGANAGSRKVDGKASGNGTQTGYSLVGAYALSKRTSISANYASWDGQNEGTPASNWGARSTYSSLLLAHSF
jgi:hypothetical protein